MLENILLIGSLLILLAVSPYLIYLIGIWFGMKPSPVPHLDEYPFISIIIPAFNEEVVISQRIRNISESSYPTENIEIIMIDDSSDDNTKAVAEKTFSDSRLNGRVLTNETRKGTNQSFNRGIKEARTEVIVTTGADVFFETDALRIVISRLLSDSNIGAVCADMQPLPHREQLKTVVREQSYRDYYGLMCIWESAHDSTFNFNGGLVAFKKGDVDKIVERRGSDDANTAFEVIRNGKRAVYEMDALVYEDIPNLPELQSEQKIRRAKRLIEATLANLDLLRQKRPFSRFFYPLRIFMNIVSPLFFFIGIGLLLISMAQINLILVFIISAVFLICIARITIFSVFLVNQYYLFRGLLNLGKETLIWESTSRKI